MFSKPILLHKVIPGFFLVLVFPVSGLFIGWLVGSSRTSVVSALIPLLVGLLGAVAYSVFERKSVYEKLMKGLQELEKASTVPAGTTGTIATKLEGDTNTSWWLPA